MPTRQPPGLKPALFVSLSLATILAGTTYWFWTAREAAESRASEALRERDAARRGQADAAVRLAAVRQRITREAGLELEQLLAAADDDIRQFGAGLPNETYADVVRRLNTLLEGQREELRQITADKREIEKKYAALESIKQVAVREATTASSGARQELVTERAEHNREMTGKDQEIAAIMDRANTLASKLETEERDKARVREELLGQVNRLRQILVAARAPHTPNELARQKPDGKVIRSSAATKTAWVSIGSRDGVRPQLTFSVQPAGFGGNPFQKPKAKLEIVRVTAPDLAEARIVEQTLTDPVLSGDLIYNPAWNPGHSMRFALAGRLDLDGDGEDDRGMIRQLIEKAGGKIDAEVLPDGTERGEVTVETNYFIRGAGPDLERAGAAGARVLNTMATMERKALDYGAVVLDMSKFLDLMGYSDPKRVRTTSTPRSRNGR